MQELNSYKSIRKRCMLLLEVLISIALIAFCILPLITPHIAMIKEQYKLDTAMKLDHAVRLLYVDVLEQMHKDQIKWGQVVGKSLIPVNEAMWERIGRHKMPLKGFFRFEEVKHKPNKPSEWNAYLFKLTFYFFPPDAAVDEKKAEWVFPYKLALLKHSPEEKASAEELAKEEKAKKEKEAQGKPPAPNQNKQTPQQPAKPSFAP